MDGTSDAHEKQAAIVAQIGRDLLFDQTHVGISRAKVAGKALGSLQALLCEP